MSEENSTSLFEQLGGEAAVDAAVEVFYKKVLEDHRIYRFFDNVDMEKQAAKQKAFLTMAFGGPSHYSGKDLRAGHAKLVKMGLDDSHFNAVLENLEATLIELGVEQELVCLLYTSPSPRDGLLSRMPSSA